MLWYHDNVNKDIKPSPGHRRDSPPDGYPTRVPVFLRVGDEIVACSQVEQSGLLANASVSAGTYAIIAGRGQLGSQIQEHYVERDSSEPESVTQGLGFSVVDIPRAWLYMLLGGSGVHSTNDSTYDRDWDGGGAYIPVAYVDKSSFELQAERINTRAEVLGVFDPQSLRDVMTGDLIMLGLAIVAGSSQIRLVDVSPASQYEAANSVLALDTTNTRTIGARGVGYDQSERRIVNDLELAIGYDSATGEHRDKLTYVEAFSAGTWGRSPRLRIESRSIASRPTAQRSAAIMAGAYAWPYSVIEVSVSTPLVWTTEVGDIVTISHDLLPEFTAGLTEISATPGRGISSVPCRVMSVERIYPADGQTSTERGRLVLVASNAQSCSWAPACVATAYDGGTETFTITEHAYSSASDSTTDASRFVVGDRVRLRTYDGSTSELREISTASSTQLRMSVTPTLTAVPIIIEPAPYSDADMQDAQRYAAFMADTDGDLDRSGGTADPPRIYR